MRGTNQKMLKRKHLLQKPLSQDLPAHHATRSQEKIR